MKVKLMLTTLCLMLAVSVFAQSNERGGRQRGQRGNFDMVVDTAVVNKLGLDQATYDKVLTLQKNKQEEMKEMMKDLARPERGKRMSDADRQAMVEKRQAFTAGYRKELREILGTEKYVEYLERQLDARQMFGNAQGNQRRGNANNRWGNGNRQRQQNQGFGGNMDD